MLAEVTRLGISVLPEEVNGYGPVVDSRGPGAGADAA